MINNTWRNLYENVKKYDSESQMNYLKLIGEVRELPLEVLENEEAIFIPNETYVTAFAGSNAALNENGFYYNGEAIWHDYLIFPIRNINNEAKGIGGFCPRLYLQAKETNDYSLHYYSYSGKSLFNKGAYLFWGRDGFTKAYEAGYVILVDGMFDAIQLRRLGFNAAALMGSYLTDAIIAQLRFFKKIIIVTDNDEAGFKLETKLGFIHKNCAYLRQSFDKDIDGAIKAGYKSIIEKELNVMIEEKMAINHIIRI